MMPRFELVESESSRSNGGELIHIASRIFNTPLLIEPNKLQAILHAIGDRMHITVEAPTDPALMRQPQAFHPGFTDEDFESGRYPRGRYMVRNGVAILEIQGTLVHKGAWMGSYSGMTSYDGIGRQLDMIAADEDVKALLLNMHSYGGEIAGCFDLADQIYEMRGSMPITALVSDAAASAAYAIASAADEVVLTQAGLAGSIGVVLTHYDLTKCAEQQGVAVTHIYAGKEKVLGTPFKALSAADRRKLQDEVDDLYEMFLAKVARNRDTDANIFRDTEAAVFYADKAIAARLADRIGSPRAVLAELMQKVSPGLASRMEDEGEDDMFSDAAAAATTQEKVAMTDQAKAAADEQKAVTQKLIAEARQAGKAEGAQEAVTAERERIGKILGSEQAKERSSLAHHLALETDMTSEAAIALLGKSAPESSGATPLRSAMSAQGTPGISNPQPPEVDVEAVRIDSASIYAARRKAARA
jgi:signal peptide peptidase SppA